VTVPKSNNVETQRAEFMSIYLSNAADWSNDSSEHETAYFAEKDDRRIDNEIARSLLSFLNKSSENPNKSFAREQYE
jgi:hypothetical protein